MLAHKFVFVVCGNEIHINTLNFSLRYLKHFSSNEIIVVTDLTRNESSIDHDNIVDVRTPQAYSHHQASIYLKTGLSKFLPKGFLYCYLDSDVLALNKNCDLIFKEFISPIRFAADHCTINLFSPIAMNCNCHEKISKNSKAFSLFLDENKERFDAPRASKNKQAQLLELFKHIDSSPIKKLYYKFKFKLFPKLVWVSSKFYFDKRKKAWFDKNQRLVMHHFPIESIAKKFNCHFDKQTMQWLNTFGNNYWTLECDHLIEGVRSDFQVDITNREWQHWNGGVFLFSDESEDFMLDWHATTLKTFEKPNWKTRDQGTLALTAWKFGLENHPVLDKKWNFIADDNNEHLKFNSEGYFSENNWKSKHKVNFAHVYHRFGDESWDLWNYLANKQFND